VVKALSHLDDIDFDISNTEADVVGYAHEYRIGESTSGAGKKNPASSIPRKRYQPYRPRWSPTVKSARFPCMTRPVVQITCCCGRSVKVKTWIYLRSSTRLSYLNGIVGLAVCWWNAAADGAVLCRV